MSDDYHCLHHSCIPAHASTHTNFTMDIVFLSKGLTVTYISSRQCISSELRENTFALCKTMVADCLIKRYQLPASIPYVRAHIAHHAPYIQVQLPFRNIISRITWILIMHQAIRSPSSLTAFAQLYLQKKTMISLFSRDVLECKVIPCWVTC